MPRTRPQLRYRAPVVALRCVAGGKGGKGGGQSRGQMGCTEWNAQHSAPAYGMASLIGEPDRELATPPTGERERGREKRGERQQQQTLPVPGFSLRASWSDWVGQLVFPPPLLRGSVAASAAANLSVAGGKHGSTVFGASFIRFQALVYLLQTCLPYDPDSSATPSDYVLAPASSRQRSFLTVAGPACAAHSSCASLSYAIASHRISPSRLVSYYCASCDLVAVWRWLLSATAHVLAVALPAFVVPVSSHAYWHHQRNDQHELEPIALVPVLPQNQPDEIGDRCSRMDPMSMASHGMAWPGWPIAGP
ncbi:uncharacterized protein BP5553_09255 [Venustampulla echinocandica]|uniref:Uncharacterized protein n=1 Tax=Venustampulla echinocandica TaxID=2656787 RepID=A0A370TC73_9HELO|nr:uncharacterized protein BP5553_09255 [Venustampulla echinocandica]RDL31853.1 hypothetical protein BP5553_09255 [Venustampulla echinocandica]